jgi:hypothetical protein
LLPPEGPIARRNRPFRLYLIMPARIALVRGTAHAPILASSIAVSAIATSFCAISRVIQM